ncbi:MAG TPA: hypothetical protein VFW11_15880 [Cyclobacteriaceae bacterium]|nr:hypothetical protein [Cyclobacteriaceae bacterium]
MTIKILQTPMSRVPSGGRMSELHAEARHHNNSNFDECAPIHLQPQQPCIYEATWYMDSFTE